MTIQAIHEHTGRSVQTITNRLKLLELPGEIQEMVREGRLPNSDALRLAQFRTRKGQLVKLAYMLVHGERPLELFEAGLGRGDGSYRNLIRASKTPGTPADYLRRFMIFEPQARAGIRAMKGLLTLSPEERDPVWWPLHPRSKTYIADLLRELAKAVAEFGSAMATWGGKAKPDLVVPEPVVQPAQPQPAVPIPRPAVRGTSADQLTLLKVERRAFPDPGRPPLPAQVVALQPAQPTSRPTPIDGRFANQPPRRKYDTFDFLRALETLKVLFPYERLRGLVAVPDRLSKQRIGRTLNGLSLQNAEARALKALRICWERWREPPATENEAEKELIKFASKVRFDLGDLRAFGDFIERLKREDRSSDPIDLAKI